MVCILSTEYKCQMVIEEYCFVETVNIDKWLYYKYSTICVLNVFLLNCWCR